MSRRWWLYAALLLGAATLVLFGDRTPPPAADTVVAAVDRGGRVASGAAPEPVVVQPPRWVAVRERETLWQSRQARSAVRDIFAAHAWAPPAKPGAIQAQPAEPQPPPLPFAFLGKRQEGEVREVFLARGDLTFVVREGTVIEGTYRIDTIQPPTLTMTYLPLSRTQTLAIGSAD